MDQEWEHHKPVHRHPWLHFYLFIIQRFTGTQDATAVLEKFLILFEGRGEVRGRLMTLVWHAHTIFGGMFDGSALPGGP